MSETYYGRFYGFDSPPFHITADPSLLFATETHQQALGAIEYGIASGKGFIVISGEVGVGKTTVLKMCLDNLGSSTFKIVYLFNPALATAELYATILEGLDVPLPAGWRPSSTLHMLHRALLAMHKTGYQVILAVDEAQNMPEETLEGLRILSNFETAKSKLLQIILVGQPELDTMLAKHSLRQLAQRVAVRALIKPLTWRQSCRYIEHRSQCAGRVANRPLFTAPALWYIAVSARGIPRTINICCDNALINGYGHSVDRISLRIAHESCHALRFRAPLQRSAVVAISAALLVFIVFSSDALPWRFFATPVRAVRPEVLELAMRDRGNSVGADAEKASAPSRVAAVATALPSRNAEPVRSPVARLANAAVAPADASAVVRPTAAESPPLSRLDPVRSAAIATPNTDAAPSQTPAYSAAGGPDNQDPPGFWRWFVRRGDTLYKICQVAYGLCDAQALRRVFDYNPKIASNGMIRQGQVIIMPKHLEPVRLNWE